MYGAGGKSVCLPLCVCVYVEGGEEEQREKGGGGGIIYGLKSKRTFVHV